MKKKAVAVVMTAVMALGMVSAVSVQAGIEDKTLIVGFDAEYPPYKIHYNKSGSSCERKLPFWFIVY